ncbi:hypothetical protein PCE1_003705 [Barthelona sp. PCE]
MQTSHLISEICAGKLAEHFNHSNSKNYVQSYFNLKEFRLAFNTLAAGPVGSCINIFVLDIPSYLRNNTVTMSTNDFGSRAPSALSFMSNELLEGPDTESEASGSEDEYPDKLGGIIEEGHVSEEDIKEGTSTFLTAVDETVAKAEMGERVPSKPKIDVSDTDSIKSDSMIPFTLTLEPHECPVFYVIKRSALFIESEPHKSLQFGFIDGNFYDFVRFSAEHVFNPMVTSVAKHQLSNINPTHMNQFKEAGTEFSQSIDEVEQTANTSFRLAQPAPTLEGSLKNAVTAAANDAVVDQCVELVEEWCEQIDAWLELDANIFEARARFRPMYIGAELKFWKERQMTCQVIFDQLKEKTSRSCISVLVAARSSSIKHWREYEQTLQDAMIIAKENVRALQPISRIISEMQDWKHFSKKRSYLERLWESVVSLGHSTRKYADRKQFHWILGSVFDAIIRNICDIIFKSPARSVRGLWECREVKITVSLMEQAYDYMLLIKNSFADLRKDVRSKVHIPERSIVPFTVFFDHFSRFQRVMTFAYIYSDVFKVLKLMFPNRIFSTVFDDFIKSRFDPLFGYDESAQEVFNSVENHVEEFEVELPDLLFKSFELVSKSVPVKMKYLLSFSSLVSRPALIECLRTLAIRCKQGFYTWMNSVENEISHLVHDVRNFSDKRTTVYAYNMHLQKLSNPFKSFTKLKECGMLLHEDFTKVADKYNILIDRLSEFVDDMLKTWIHTTSFHTSMLSQPLLMYDKAKRKLYINNERELLTFYKEFQGFFTLSSSEFVNLPKNREISLFLRNISTFSNYHSKMEELLKIRHIVTNSIPDQARDVFLPLLSHAEIALRKATKNLNWVSVSIDSYFENCFNLFNELNEKIINFNLRIAELYDIGRSLCRMVLLKAPSTSLKIDPTVTIDDWVDSQCNFHDSIEPRIHDVFKGFDKMYFSMLECYNPEFSGTEHANPETVKAYIKNFVVTVAKVSMLTCIDRNMRKIEKLFFGSDLEQSMNANFSNVSEFFPQFSVELILEIPRIIPNISALYLHHECVRVVKSMINVFRSLPKLTIAGVQEYCEQAAYQDDTFKHVDSNEQSIKSITEEIEFLDSTLNSRVQSPSLEDSMKIAEEFKRQELSKEMVNSGEFNTVGTNDENNNEENVEEEAGPLAGGLSIPSNAFVNNEVHLRSLNELSFMTNVLETVGPEQFESTVSMVSDFYIIILESDELLFHGLRFRHLLKVLDRVQDFIDDFVSKVSWIYVKDRDEFFKTSKMIRWSLFDFEVHFGELLEVERLISSWDDILHVNFTSFQFNLEVLKACLISELHSWSALYASVLRNRIYEKLYYLVVDCSSYLKKFEMDIETLNDFKDISIILDRLNTSEVERELSIVDIRQGYRLLGDYNYGIPLEATQVAEDIAADYRQAIRDHFIPLNEYFYQFCFKLVEQKAMKEQVDIEDSDLESFDDNRSQFSVALSHVSSSQRSLRSLKPNSSSFMKKKFFGSGTVHDDKNMAIQNAAALTIQRVWRGYVVRRNLSETAGFIIDISSEEEEEVVLPNQEGVTPAAAAMHLPLEEMASLTELNVNVENIEHSFDDIFEDFNHLPLFPGCTIDVVSEALLLSTVIQLVGWTKKREIKVKKTLTNHSDQHLAALLAISRTVKVDSVKLKSALDSSGPLVQGISVQESIQRFKDFAKTLKTIKKQVDEYQSSAKFFNLSKLDLPELDQLEVDNKVFVTIFSLHQQIDGLDERFRRSLVSGIDLYSFNHSFERLRTAFNKLDLGFYRDVAVVNRITNSLRVSGQIIPIIQIINDAELNVIHWKKLLELLWKLAEKPNNSESYNLSALCVEELVYLEVWNFRDFVERFLLATARENEMEKNLSDILENNRAKCFFFFKNCYNTEFFNSDRLEKEISGFKTDAILLQDFDVTNNKIIQMENNDSSKVLPSLKMRVNLWCKIFTTVSTLIEDLLSIQKRVISFSELWHGIMHETATSEEYSITSKVMQYWNQLISLSYKRQKLMLDFLIDVHSLSFQLSNATEVVFPQLRDILVDAEKMVAVYLQRVVKHVPRLSFLPPDLRQRFLCDIPRYLDERFLHRDVLSLLFPSVIGLIFSDKEEEDEGIVTGLIGNNGETINLPMKIVLMPDLDLEELSPSIKHFMLLKLNQTLNQFTQAIELYVKSSIFNLLQNFETDSDNSLINVDDISGSSSQTVIIATCIVVWKHTISCFNTNGDSVKFNKQQLGRIITKLNHDIALCCVHFHEFHAGANSQVRNLKSADELIRKQLGSVLYFWRTSLIQVVKGKMNADEFFKHHLRFRMIYYDKMDKERYYGNFEDCPSGIVSNYKIQYNLSASEEDWTDYGYNYVSVINEFPLCRENKKTVDNTLRLFKLPTCPLFNSWMGSNPLVSNIELLTGHKFFKLNCVLDPDVIIIERALRAAVTQGYWIWLANVHHLNVDTLRSLSVDIRSSLKMKGKEVLFDKVLHKVSEKFCVVFSAHGRLGPKFSAIRPVVTPIAIRRLDLSVRLPLTLFFSGFIFAFDIAKRILEFRRIYEALFHRRISQPELNVVTSVCIYQLMVNAPSVPKLFHLLSTVENITISNEEIRNNLFRHELTAIAASFRHTLFRHTPPSRDFTNDFRVLQPKTPEPKEEEVAQRRKPKPTQKNRKKNQRVEKKRGFSVEVFEGEHSILDLAICNSFQMSEIKDLLTIPHPFFLESEDSNNVFSENLQKVCKKSDLPAPSDSFIEVCGNIYRDLVSYKVLVVGGEAQTGKTTITRCAINTARELGEDWLYDYIPADPKSFSSILKCLERANHTDKPILCHLNTFSSRTNMDLVNFAHLVRLGDPSAFLSNGNALSIPPNFHLLIECLDVKGWQRLELFCITIPNHALDWRKLVDHFIDKIRIEEKTALDNLAMEGIYPESSVEMLEENYNQWVQTRKAPNSFATNTAYLMASGVDPSEDVEPESVEPTSAHTDESDDDGINVSTAESLERHPPSGHPSGIPRGHPGGHPSGIPMGVPLDMPIGHPGHITIGNTPIALRSPSGSRPSSGISLSRKNSAASFMSTVDDKDGKCESSADVLHWLINKFFEPLYVHIFSDLSDGDVNSNNPPSIRVTCRALLSILAGVFHCIHTNTCPLSYPLNSTHIRRLFFFALQWAVGSSTATSDRIKIFCYMVDVLKIPGSPNFYPMTEGYKGRVSMSVVRRDPYFFSFDVMSGEWSPPFRLFESRRLTDVYKLGVRMKERMLEFSEVSFPRLVRNEYVTQFLYLGAISSVGVGALPVTFLGNAGVGKTAMLNGLFDKDRTSIFMSKYCSFVKPGEYEVSKPDLRFGSHLVKLDRANFSRVQAVLYELAQNKSMILDEDLSTITVNNFLWMCSFDSSKLFNPRTKAMFFSIQLDYINQNAFEHLAFEWLNTHFTLSRGFSSDICETLPKQISYCFSVAANIFMGLSKTRVGFTLSFDAFVQVIRGLLSYPVHKNSNINEILRIYYSGFIVCISQFEDEHIEKITSYIKTFYAQNFNCTEEFIDSLDKNIVMPLGFYGKDGKWEMKMVTVDEIFEVVKKEIRVFTYSNDWRIKLDVFRIAFLLQSRHSSLIVCLLDRKYCNSELENVIPGLVHDILMCLLKHFGFNHIEFHRRLNYRELSKLGKKKPTYCIVDASILRTNFRTISKLINSIDYKDTDIKLIFHMSMEDSQLMPLYRSDSRFASKSLFTKLNLPTLTDYYPNCIDCIHETIDKDAMFLRCYEQFKETMPELQFNSLETWLRYFVEFAVFSFGQDMFPIVHLDEVASKFRAKQLPMQNFLVNDVLPEFESWNRALNVLQTNSNEIRTAFNMNDPPQKKGKQKQAVDPFTEQYPLFVNYVDELVDKQVAFDLINDVFPKRIPEDRTAFQNFLSLDQIDIFMNGLQIEFLHVLKKHNMYIGFLEDTQSIVTSLESFIEDIELLREGSNDFINELESQSKNEMSRLTDVSTKLATCHNKVDEYNEEQHLSGKNVKKQEMVVSQTLMELEEQLSFLDSGFSAYITTISALVPLLQEYVIKDNSSTCLIMLKTLHLILGGRIEDVDSTNYKEDVSFFQYALDFEESDTVKKSPLIINSNQFLFNMDMFKHFDDTELTEILNLSSSPAVGISKVAALLSSATPIAEFIKNFGVSVHFYYNHRNEAERLNHMGEERNSSSIDETLERIKELEKERDGIRRVFEGCLFQQHNEHVQIRQYETIIKHNKKLIADIHNVEEKLRNSSILFKSPKYLFLAIMYSLTIMVTTSCVNLHKAKDMIFEIQAFFKDRCGVDFTDFDLERFCLETDCMFHNHSFIKAPLEVQEYSVDVKARLMGAAVLSKYAPVVLVVENRSAFDQFARTYGSLSVERNPDTFDVGDLSTQPILIMNLRSEKDFYIIDRIQSIINKAKEAEEGFIEYLQHDKVFRIYSTQRVIYIIPNGNFILKLPKWLKFWTFIFKENEELLSIRLQTDLLRFENGPFLQQLLAVSQTTCDRQTRVYRLYDDYVEFISNKSMEIENFRLMESSGRKFMREFLNRIERTEKQYETTKKSLDRINIYFFPYHEFSVKIAKMYTVFQKTIRLFASSDIIPSIDLARWMSYILHISEPGPVASESRINSLITGSKTFLEFLVDLLPSETLMFAGLFVIIRFLAYELCAEKMNTYLRVLFIEWKGVDISSLTPALQGVVPDIIGLKLRYMFDKFGFMHRLEKQIMELEEEVFEQWFEAADMSKLSNLDKCPIEFEDGFEKLIFCITFFEHRLSLRSDAYVADFFDSIITVIFKEVTNHDMICNHVRALSSRLEMLDTGILGHVFWIFHSFNANPLQLIQSLLNNRKHPPPIEMIGIESVENKLLSNYKDDTYVLVFASKVDKAAFKCINESVKHFPTLKFVILCPDELFSKAVPNMQASLYIFYYRQPSCATVLPDVLRTLDWSIVPVVDRLKMNIFTRLRSCLCYCLSILLLRYPKSLIFTTTHINDLLELASSLFQRFPTENERIDLNHLKKIITDSLLISMPYESWIASLVSHSVDIAFAKDIDEFVPKYSINFDKTIPDLPLVDTYEFLDLIPKMRFQARTSAATKHGIDLRSMRILLCTFSKHSVFLPSVKLNEFSVKNLQTSVQYYHALKDLVPKPINVAQLFNTVKIKFNGFNTVSYQWFWENIELNWCLGALHRWCDKILASNGAIMFDELSVPLLLMRTPQRFVRMFDILRGVPNISLAGFLNVLIARVEYLSSLTAEDMVFDFSLLRDPARILAALRLQLPSPLEQDIHINADIKASSDMLPKIQGLSISKGVKYSDKSFQPSSTGLLHSIPGLALNVKKLSAERERGNVGLTITRGRSRFGNINFSNPTNGLSTHISNLSCTVSCDSFELDDYLDIVRKF